MRRERSNEETDHRFREFIDGAAEVFLRRGYGRTTMAQIAEHLGVAPGTLYLSFTGKESLFHHVIAGHLDESPIHSPRQLPASFPGLDSTSVMLEKGLRRWVDTSAVGRPPSGTPSNPEDELRAVLQSLFDGIRRRIWVITLVELSAEDWPRLDEITRRVFRQGMRDALADYLSIRMRSGDLRPLSSSRAAAEMILEGMTHFAKGDGAENPRVRQTLVDLFVHGLVADHCGRGDAR